MSEALYPAPEVANRAVTGPSTAEPLAWHERPFIKACGFT
jgi:hypothetical protein